MVNKRMKTGIITLLLFLLISPIRIFGQSKEIASFRLLPKRHLSIISGVEQYRLNEQERKSYLDEEHHVWDSLFSLPGIAGLAGSIVLSSAKDKNNGNIYFGGWFSHAGFTSANNIVMWDGTSWQNLGNGLSYDGDPNQALVSSILIDNSGKVYVGGLFDKADDLKVDNIAMWDGSKWHAVGKGFNDVVMTLAFDMDSILYAGGYFTQSGEENVQRIARFEENTWKQVGDGISEGNIRAITFNSENRPYIGGVFQQSNGHILNNVAKLGDKDIWVDMNSGLVGDEHRPPVVRTLCFRNDELYIGGYFLSAINPDDFSVMNYSGLALWKDKKWIQVPVLFSHDDNRIPVYGYGIFSIVKDEIGNLYLGGRLPYIMDVDSKTINTNGVFKWSNPGTRGETFEPLNNGLSSLAMGFRSTYVTGIIPQTNDKMIVSGAFSGSNDTYMELFSNVASFNNGQWNAFNDGKDYNGISSVIEEMVVDSKGNVYSIIRTDVVEHNGSLIDQYRLVKWNGKNWSIVDDKYFFYFASIEIDDEDNLYVGGWLVDEKREVQMGIVKWNGTDWEIIGHCRDGSSIKLKWKNGLMYALGQFSQINNVTARRLAKWDGSTWQGFGILDQDFPISEIEVDDENNVYVAGHFQSIAGKQIKGLAKYSDTHGWQQVGDGIDPEKNTVFSLFAASDGLYLGGSFNQVDGVDARGIIKWDGKKWSDLGGGLISYMKSPDGSQSNAYVMAIHKVNDKLIVGGIFDEAGGLSASNLAVWENNQWSSIGGLVDDFIGVIASSKEYLYVGGAFTFAFNQPAFKFTRYKLENILHADDQILSNEKIFTLVPNPFRDRVSINFKITQPNPVGLVIYDINGNLVHSREIEFMETGHHTLFWDGRSDNNEPMTPGIYLCQLVIGKKRDTQKVVLKGK